MRTSSSTSSSSTSQNLAGEYSDGESSASSMTESEGDVAEAPGPEPAIASKRIRKAVQHFDVLKDGANDTKRRKESK